MGQIAFRKGYRTTYGSTVVTESPVDIPAHASIVVSVADQEWDFKAGPPTCSISDDQSAGTIVFTPRTRRLSGSGPGVQQFYCADTGAAAYTAALFTAAFSANQRASLLAVHILDGMDAGAFFVDDDVATGLSQTMVTTPALTTPDNVIVFAVATSSNDRTFTEDAGFTEDCDLQASPVVRAGQAQHKDVAGGVNPTVSTTASASTNLIIAAAAFKVAASGANASGSGVTNTATAPTGSAVGYAQVTLTSVYTGVGSLLSVSNFTGTPVIGDTIRYPTTGGFIVLPDGTIQCDTNTGSYVCYYNDGGGETSFTVTLNSTAYASGAGVTNTATAPTGSASSPNEGNASGAGVTNTATAPTGSAAGAAQASGDGVTNTATAPDGSAFGGSPGNASGSGVTDTTSAPVGGATGAALATGAGVENTTSAPDGGATGGFPGNASGAGVTNTATATTGAATGSAQVSAPGVTDVASAPAGVAAGGAQATGSGVTNTATEPTGSASANATAVGSGVTDTATAPSGTGQGAAHAQGDGVVNTVSAPSAGAEVITTAQGAGVVAQGDAFTGFSMGGAEVTGGGDQAESISAEGYAVEVRESRYTSRQEMIARFGETEILQLTDHAGNGEIDDAVLAQAMSDADMEIDGYLQGRYQLPLTVVPRILAVYACDIARYRLYDDRVTDAVTKRYNDALKFLMLLAQGRASLGLAPTGEMADHCGGPQYSGDERVFSRDKLKGFH